MTTDSLGAVAGAGRDLGASAASRLILKENVLRMFSLFFLTPCPVPSPLPRLPLSNRETHRQAHHTQEHPKFHPWSPLSASGSIAEVRAPKGHLRKVHGLLIFPLLLQKYLSGEPMILVCVLDHFLCMYKCLGSYFTKEIIQSCPTMIFFTCGQIFMPVHVNLPHFY